jgi:putative ABC transport system substrate-binding protein
VQLDTIQAYRPLRRLGIVYNPTFSATELIVRADKAMLALASSAYGIGRLTAFKAAQILIDMATVRVLEYCSPIGLLNFAEIIES